VAVGENELRTLSPRSIDHRASNKYRSPTRIALDETTLSRFISIRLSSGAHLIIRAGRAVLADRGERENRRQACRSAPFQIAAPATHLDICRLLSHGNVISAYFPGGGEKSPSSPAHCRISIDRPADSFGEMKYAP